jgi:drug/metabolite transporter (DMT)-like permease
VNNEATQRREASESAPLQPLDWLLLVIPGLIWGSSFYFIDIGLDSFAPGLITPMRVLFGCITLSMIPKARQPVPKMAWPNIVVLSLVWLAVPLTVFPFAEQHVSSSVTGMLNGATPLFVAVVASVIARRLPPSGQMLGLAIGFVGVVLIALPSIRESSSSMFGVVLILGALVLYGFALNVASPLQQLYGSLPVLLRAEIVAVILLAPLGVFSLFNNDRPFSWGPFAAMLALGVLGTAMAHFAMVTLSGRIGSTRAAGSLYLMPAVSLALGVLVNHETVAPLAVIGSVVAVVGASVLGRSKRVTATGKQS